MEITSRYDGVVTKVHYKVGEMAKVGSTLIDIEVDEAVAAAVHGSAPSGGNPESPTKSKAPTPVLRAPMPKPAATKEAAPVLEPIEVEVPLRMTRLPVRAHGDDERVRYLCETELPCRHTDSWFISICFRF